MSSSYVNSELIWTEGNTAGEGESLRLAVSRCGLCGGVDFPVREHCSTCGATVEKTMLSARGRLGAFTAVLHPPPGGEVPVPYAVGIAAFPEGVSVLGLLHEVEPDAGRPWQIGEDVETVAVRVGPVLTYGFARPQQGT